jgi:D-alanyl-D-alanine dipeptidase
MIVIAVRDGRSDDPVRPSPSMGWWCVVMWALFTGRAVKSTATGFHVQDIKVKLAIRSSPSVYRLVLVFAACISVFACSPDAAQNWSAEAPATLQGQPAGAGPGAVTSRSPAPDAPPTRWVELIGEYGPDYDVWMVLEDDARLYLRQGESSDPLEESSPDEFFSRRSGEGAAARLLFTRGEDGRAAIFQMGGSYFTRREIGTIAGETFRIEPVRDVEELRVEALVASPSVEEGPFRESELVDLASLDPTIRLDIRYATTNNFMNAVFYEDARAFLQRPGAEAVARAHRALTSYGYGLLIHDGYRPWYVTKMFWDATPPHQREFVANPASGSRHNRGAAVDLSLYDLLSGEPIEMPGSYDEFSHRSYSDYPGGTARQRWHRDLLRQVMESQGFTVNPGEWWHFDYRDWSEYGIQNEVLGEIGTPNEGDAVP